MAATAAPSATRPVPTLAEEDDPWPEFHTAVLVAIIAGTLFAVVIRFGLVDKPRRVQQYCPRPPASSN